MRPQSELWAPDAFNDPGSVIVVNRTAIVAILSMSLPVSFRGPRYARRLPVNGQRAFVIGVWIACLQGAWGVAHSVEIEAHRAEEAVVVFHASADVATTPQIAWSVLTDYDRLADFIPDLRSSRVVARTGSEIVIEQLGEARLLFFSVPISVRLAIVEEPFRRVTSHAVGGDFKEMEGRYDLEPTEHGLHFTYSGRLIPAFSLPPLIGVAILRNAVRRQFGAMVDEINRRAAGALREP